MAKLGIFHVPVQRKTARTVLNDNNRFLFAD
ncbi:unnamed protein product, partial [marine sediment metagenome]